MKIRFALVLFPVVALLAGCSTTPPTNPVVAKPSGSAVDSDTASNLAKLSPEDRKLAEAQKVCPITGEPLGSKDMGVPVKIMLKDQPVFLCCKSCEKKALADPDKTLKAVADAKAK